METTVQQKIIHPISGGIALLCILGAWLIDIALLVWASIQVSTIPSALWITVLVITGLLCILIPILFYGLKIVGPNEALVLTLFGKYYGTIIDSGFYFVNPFVTYNNPVYRNELARKFSSKISINSEAEIANTKTASKKTVSLKSMTLNNGKQKVNDILGNPIIIGAVVIWSVKNPTLAVFQVENYTEFLSIQTDTTIRNIARKYPYDDFDEARQDNEKTLRGSQIEIANRMKEELNQRVKVAGLWVEDVRITHLSYAEEIAAAMLQRQQASAIIAARQKIVDGAVGMVKMAIDKLGEEEVVVLDEERKAQMVSNLLVVLCSNKETQPVVNNGSIY